MFNLLPEKAIATKTRDPKKNQNKKQGFNAVRLPFRFRDVKPGRVPYNYTRLCGVPSQDDAKSSSVVPPRDSRPTSIPAATRAVSAKNGNGVGAASASSGASSSSSVKVPLRLPSQVSESFIFCFSPPPPALLCPLNPRSSRSVPDPSQFPPLPPIVIPNPSLPRSRNLFFFLAQDFPEIPLVATSTKGICNARMPQRDARERFLWNVELLIDQGMYVMLDYHPGIDVVGAERSVLSVGEFVSGWREVLTSVLEAVPAARGRLLVDLLNEPDAFALTWNSAGGALSIKSPSQEPRGLVYAPSRPSLNALYSAALDALYPICRECVFLIEGGGQSSVPGVHWGNGFVSDEGLAAKRGGLQTPNAFFDAAIEGKAPWLKQLVLAPHVYCPRVSGAVECYEGQCLFESLDRSFGELTRGKGYCSRGESKDCVVFAAVIGELGSTLENERESSCIASVVDWVMAAGKGGF